MIVRFVLFALVLLINSSSASAQSFSVGFNFASAQWSEFEGTDYGFGAKLSWNATNWVGIDSELIFYPSEYPDRTIPFSDSRFEGLFGATIGPRLGRVRVFGRGAAGFLQVSESPRPFACILIFPPPLACLMAAGQTLPAYDLGGGIELSTSSGTFVRGDVSDRILKYPAPTFRQGLVREDEGFYGHAFRFALSGGFRF